MGFIFVNPNPDSLFIGDCVVRAISLALGRSWNDIYLDLSAQGFIMKDMPSSNAVWGEYLKQNGFKRYIIPDDCPGCFNLKQFCLNYPTGTYVLTTGSHAVAVINGDYYDTADSGDCIPIYFYRKEDHMK